MKVIYSNQMFPCSSIFSLVGVAYTNVAWFAYMMRPNVDKSTFILLDKTPFENDHTLSNW